MRNRLCKDWFSITNRNLNWKSYPNWPTPCVTRRKISATKFVTRGLFFYRKALLLSWHFVTHWLCIRIWNPPLRGQGNTADIWNIRLNICLSRNTKTSRQTSQNGIQIMTQRAVFASILWFTIVWHAPEKILWFFKKWVTILRRLTHQSQ